MNTIKTIFISLFFIALSISMSAQCSYSIVLYDTFGDGWNGGEVSISVNGTPVGTYTISTGGGPETHFFQVSTGNTIHATYTAGTWGYENEYYIYDSENNLIFSDGVGGVQPTANNTLVGTGICPSCGMPGTLIATNISDVSANLSWVESGSATQWNIQWGATGFSLGSGTIIPSTTSNPYPLSGLTSSTGYDFYVQADCGGGDTSVWAGPYTFYTAACPLANQCKYMLYLNDVGNSWNGAYIDVVQDGISLGTFTITGGGTHTDSVYLCEGSNVQLIWSSGMYDNETSFDMQTPWATSVFSWTSGGNPSVGVFHTFTAYCTPPTCPSPTNLGYANSTTTSADLSWQENGSATIWNIEYGPEGFTQGLGTFLSGVNTNPYTLNGLTIATAYDFYVQSDCGGGDTSFWSGPFTFHTASCLPVDQCVYSMFLGDTYGDGWNGASVTVEQDGMDIGNYTLATGDSITHFVSLCNGSNVSLIWNNGTFDTECYFRFYDPFSQLVTEFAAGTIPSAGPFFTFTVYCTPPTCPAPSALGASFITDQSASLSWQENGSATLWNIEYGPDGFVQGTGTVLSGVTTNPYVLNGLSSGTAYDFYVQSDCGGGDLSLW
ncbi:MAG: fibronectin type III domain-containing protein, partial [Bacteroidota bacterium]